MKREFSEELNRERFNIQPNEYRFKIGGDNSEANKVLEERNKKNEAEALEKYMPIGSIVKIRDSFKKYMIIGFNCKDDKYIFDYLACEYPYGVGEKHKNSHFNHEDIERIYHIGFFNEQERNFKRNLLDEQER